MILTGSRSWFRLTRIMVISAAIGSCATPPPFETPTDPAQLAMRITSGERLELSCVRLGDRQAWVDLPEPIELPGGHALGVVLSLDGGAGPPTKHRPLSCCDASCLCRMRLDPQRLLEHPEEEFEHPSSLGNFILLVLDSPNVTARGRVRRYRLSRVKNHLPAWNQLGQLRTGESSQIVEIP